MEPITVHVHAWDPISAAGVISELRPRPEIRVVSPQDADLATVVVVVADAVDEEALKTLRTVQRQGTARSVLVAGRLEEGDLVKIVETGVVGIARRCEATPDRLVTVITAAASGEGCVPPDLLGRLLEQVGRLQRHVLGPRGIMFTGLAPREVDVLRLLADGLDTAEIARRLAYSERTVKNVVHDVTTRLQLRNRSHAVAYALREGLI
ncbi:DNA-binding response regulator [Kocuria sediminis]|uniref:DNA-binding response regulator n=1 Tax=Kocuria sediminis TaxID=1038857 RepID=A0A6N8GI94_9MICC|nr:response regulator transcription factor [Kocuria sediminis]MUN61967.1 DNA-binding response regulator [Kocuria sediminis]